MMFITSGTSCSIFGGRNEAILGQERVYELGEHLSNLRFDLKPTNAARDLHQQATYK